LGPGHNGSSREHFLFANKFEPFLCLTDDLDLGGESLVGDLLGLFKRFEALFQPFGAPPWAQVSPHLRCQHQRFGLRAKKLSRQDQLRKNVITSFTDYVET